jgi:hypothetical protein
VTPQEWVEAALADAPDLTDAEQARIAELLAPQPLEESA